MTVNRSSNELDEIQMAENAVTKVDNPSNPISDLNMSSTLVGNKLVLSYPSAEDPVLNEESIVAESGSVTALTGPNGSGKSTLLKGLANQLAPTGGSVLIDGRDIHSLGTKKLARKLGLLSQESISPGSITVEDLVFHGRYPHRRFFEHVTKEDRQVVEQAMELAGCRHLRDREISSLSGGQKQLAWIAMVIAQDTDVLLLDEPTTFLDLHHQLEVMEIVETLRDENELAIIVVLHDIEQAARYADYIVTLRDGKIQVRGTPEEVITEKLLAEVFRIEATVEPTDHGPRIMPTRAIHDDSSSH